MTEQELKLALSSFPEGWKALLEKETEKPYYQSLLEAVSQEYLTKKVYPPYPEVFRALALTKPEDVKVIIIGQDPYFNPGQANGLAFSVADGVRFPPSLLNIYKELYYEFGYPIPKSGSLEPWSKQGVLLLNASLTVREGVPNSHAGLGWMTFTDEIIQVLDQRDEPLVYLLWGNFAYEKAKPIHSKKSLIIHTAHPSPLSAKKGFFCSDCFKRANRFLKENKRGEIDWQIR